MPIGTGDPSTAYGMWVSTGQTPPEIMTGQPLVSNTIAGVGKDPAVHCCRTTLVTAAVMPSPVTVVVRTCSIPVMVVPPAVYEHPVDVELSTSKRTTY